MAVVLDSGPLIKGSDLRKLGDVFYTIPQVLQEVRDSHAREKLLVKLEEIKTTDPTEADILYVIEFSKKTGDYPSLSDTDIRILALACRLHRESGGTLSDSPGEIRPFQNQAKLDEWITPENYKVQDGRVCLVSYDFAVQNVGIQAGIKLVNNGGLEIRFLKRWAKRCKSCGEVCEDVEKEFCPDCGNHTLVKVSYTVEADGSKKFYEPRIKRNLLAGTVYPIPAPKGGKNCEDVILREDQLFLMGGRQNKWNWKKPKVYDAESVDVFGHNLKATSGFRYGPHRKNPNEPHKKNKKRI